MAQPQLLSKDIQLSKRRRFAPNTLPSIFLDNTDAPLLNNMCDVAPSQQEIEAQLLQVGMRVRKSVNEGYQNTPAKRAFTPRPFFNSNRLSPDTISALSAPASDDYSAGGLHKVGGLAMQPLTTATFCGINLAAMSHMSSSPAISEQKLWSYSTASKRRQHFDEDSDSDDSQDFMPRTPQLECADAGVAMPQDYFNITFDEMAEDTTVFHREERRYQVHGRKMAQPRLRRGHQQEQTPATNPFAQLAAYSPVQQRSGHQRMRSCGMDAMDFGEAAFLQPRQDVDMDCS